MTLKNMNDLQKSIDGWEGKTIGQSCNEFILEGTLMKVTGRRQTERYVFLFDGLIVLTKQNTKRSSTSNSNSEYKLKEKFFIRKLEVIDKDDTEELKNAFELQIRNHPNVILLAKTMEDKYTWMSVLLKLMHWSNLERTLDVRLKEEEARHPLKPPSPEFYPFSVEDCDGNIVFEENQMSKECPLIKGGTLLKLVERLTYHTYADPKFVRTFLTTYRTFCQPFELLDLLIKRFEIPEFKNEETFDLVVRDDIKRFKNEYSKPVQFRVLNVLRHWVDQHWYDFESNETLQIKLTTFLESVRGKAMRKWVESIEKIINRKHELIDRPVVITFKNKPPAIERHIATKVEEFDLMTLHPVEIARQLTLLEFDLYRSVKPSEMVGSAWMKKNKNITSSNLLKVIQHSTRFTFWLEKCIIESENFEERVAVFSRIVEVMIVFQELNNFNGVVEVVSALNSASVHRLEHTRDEVQQKNHKLIKAFEEAKELNSDHYKRYIEKLRSIDPPCVPFLGMYLTNILHTEEGNPDFLPKSAEGLINFSKRRKIADITAEIQQYQNQPYSLCVEPSIRKYFENLDPLEGRTENEFNDYLYEKSLLLEPRGAKTLPKFERKRDYALKSPGVKPTALRMLSNNFKPATSQQSLNTSSDDLSEVNSSYIGSCSTTPPTPLSPIDETSDFSVFKNITLPQDPVSMTPLNLSQQTLHNSSLSLSSDTSEVNLHEDKPPPIPPRIPRGPGRQQREAPPPIAVSVNCVSPPLPPRRVDASHSFNHFPIHSMYIQEPPNVPRQQPVPDLPPKTYR